MKKTVVLLGFGALCAGILLLIYCTKVDFNNPLDKDGSDYLKGVDTSVISGIGEQEILENYYNPAINSDWFCEKPVLSIPNNGSIEIGSNEPTKFNNYVGQGPEGFDKILGCVGCKDAKNSVIWRVEVKDGQDVVWTNGQMPTPSTYPHDYTIVYIATKTCISSGTVLTSDPVQRSLRIVEEKEDDRTPPVIDLGGVSSLVLSVGDEYKEMAGSLTIPKVTAHEAKDVNATLKIDSIVVWRTDNGRTRLDKVIPPAEVTLVTDFPKRTYELAYYTHSAAGIRNEDKNNIRTVTIEEVAAAREPAIIVLNKYRHNINGVTIEHADTAFRANGQWNFVEKQPSDGVAEVYYMKNGVKTQIDKSRVNRQENRPSTNQLGERGTSVVTYSVTAFGSEYNDASINRSVHRWGSCDAPDSKPTFTAIPARTLKISDLQYGRWPTTEHWTGVTASNNNEDGGTAIRYVIDFGTLDPNNLKAGSYTLKYVALSTCGLMEIAERSITVVP